MIKRDFKEDLSIFGRKEEIIIKKDKKKKVFEPLKRILIIGPNYDLRCHFSENVYDLMKEMDYDVKILGIEDLSIETIHLQFGYPLSLNGIIQDLDDWKPQLVIIDQIHVNFDNNQNVPVFYHHRNYNRNPTVFHPNIVYFWHEDILKFYETRFVKEWMAQVEYKEISYISFNSNRFKTGEKVYKGINCIGFRESPKEVYEINELFEIAPARILEMEYNEFKDLGFNVFDTPITDEQYRDILPKCEAVWSPLSTRQFTSRRMIEAMGCKTLVVLKLENKRHEEILAKMGFENFKHYIGVKELKDIERIYNKTRNKKKIVENAYNIVMNNHTYQNRVDQIIEKYEEMTNKSL